jgi:hypothetical protein
MRRVARRNSLDVNVPRADGSVVFAQLELVDAFHVRSDLWLESADGDRRRITRDARLVQPDARDDGAIVAVQFVDGTTRLVAVDAATGRIAALTTTHPDTQWAEPRWGGVRGTEVAAVRRVRGGRSEVVRLDSAGRATVLLASDRIEASPAWSAGACRLWSVSDRGGLPEPLVTYVNCSMATGSGGATSGGVSGVPRSTAGVVALDVSRAGGDAAVAVLGIGGSGYRLLTHALASLAVDATVRPLADSLDAARRALADTAGQGAGAGAARRYSPWRGLVPRWWLPLVGETADGTTTLGAYSSGSDVVARHLWSAEVMVPVRRSEELDGALTWRWRGLGQPAIDVALVQEWARGRTTLVDTNDARTPFRYARPERTASLGVSFVRPRVYTSASLSAGVEYEWFEPLRTEPAAVLSRLATRFQERTAYPGAYLSASWAALQRAPQAVSAEDGVSVGGTVRQRWQGDADLAPGRTAIGVLRGYRSVSLPGYARHVLATRLSAAWANDASLDDWSAGGTSGASLEVLPGVTVGDASRSFGVRGFAAGTQRGNRALGGALEYRAPLFIANRGLGLTPLYLARTGITLFGEGASAWCAVAAAQPVCDHGPTPRTWMASVGGEAWIDASATFDVPYRLRFGVAAPVSARELSLGGTRRPASAYVTFGAAF